MEEPGPPEQPQPGEPDHFPPKRLEKVRIELPDGRYLLLYKRRARQAEPDAS